MTSLGAPMALLSCPDMELRAASIPNIASLITSLALPCEKEITCVYLYICIFIYIYMNVYVYKYIRVKRYGLTGRG
jgi:hypothetical protein